MILPTYLFHFSTPYAHPFTCNLFIQKSSLIQILLDAAYDLGATPGKALWKVVLPQLRGSIVQVLQSHLQ